MRLSAEERAVNRSAFRAMGPKDKTEYVFAYYKLPLTLALIVVVALGWVVSRALTHKAPLLYTAFVNVVPNERLDEALTTGFVEQLGADPRKSEVVCYRELYLSNDAPQQDHQYAYASRLKLMASVDAEQLDVLLMNQEAYDLLSAGGYLLDMGTELTGTRALPAAADGLLVTNTVVLADNRVELELGEADSYEATTVEATNALEAGDLPLFDDYAPDERFYLGIVANTPRLDMASAYLRYVVDHR